MIIIPRTHTYTYTRKNTHRYHLTCIHTHTHRHDAYTHTHRKIHTREPIVSADILIIGYRLSIGIGIGSNLRQVGEQNENRRIAASLFVYGWLVGSDNLIRHNCLALDLHGLLSIDLCNFIRINDSEMCETLWISVKIVALSFARRSAASDPLATSRSRQSRSVGN